MTTANTCWQLAKCLRYVGFLTLCDAMFGVFMLSWFFFRHVVYLAICWSIYSDIPRIIEYGCYTGKTGNLTGPMPTPQGLGYLVEPFVYHDSPICWNQTLQWAFLGPLLALQGIFIWWFFMIVRVAVRVLSGGGGEDPRSDGEEEEEDEYVYEEAVEEEVTADQLDLKGWERRAGVKRPGAGSSSVSLPGHSDRKELLGRIGCEKQVD
jgi:acyl-CoA-dependent ceramide synthase